jgi:hypothetical protein
MYIAGLYVAVSVIFDRLYLNKPTGYTPAPIHLFDGRPKANTRQIVIASTKFLLNSSFPFFFFLFLGSQILSPIQRTPAELTSLTSSLLIKRTG